MFPFSKEDHLMLLLLLLLLLQGIDIVPTLIQINPDLRFFPYPGPEAPGECCAVI
jgi:hypothetical protein